MNPDSDSRPSVASPADQNLENVHLPAGAIPMSQNAEQLAGADALVELGRWLKIRQLTDGICTEHAEALIDLLTHEEK